MTLKEMLEARAKLVADARAIQAKAETEKRDLNAEEVGQINKQLDEADKLKTQIDAREQAAQQQRRLADAEREIGTSRGRETDPITPGATRGTPAAAREFRYRCPASGVERVYRMAGRTASEEYRNAFGRFLGTGYEGMTPEQRGGLQADSDVEGGFLNAPQQMVAELLKGMDNAVQIRQFARVFQLGSSDSLGVPTLDTDLGDADWTSEIAAVTEDTALRFGRRELEPKPLSKLVKVSRKLLRTAVMDPEAIVRDRLGYKFGTTQEAAFMTGTGANQPLGLFTAHADGISTGRDVSTSNTTTAIVADNLIYVKASLKPQYLANARWIFHRDAVRNLSLLKDGDGQYLWRTGLVAGSPDTLLGLPIVQSEYAPNTFTTGLYVGLLGDLSFYWIAENLKLEIQRLAELYAATNQIGFIGRAELDAMPVLEEAFARVKLG